MEGRECSTEERGACLQWLYVASHCVHWSDGARGQPLLKRGQDNVRSREGERLGRAWSKAAWAPGSARHFVTPYFVLRLYYRQGDQETIRELSRSNNKQTGKWTRRDALHSFTSLPESRKCNDILQLLPGGRVWPSHPVARLSDLIRVRNCLIEICFQQRNPPAIDFY